MSNPQGLSILDQFWVELDDVMDRLPLLKLPRLHAKVRGEALGIATCIAILSDPTLRDVKSVLDEAQQRYEKRVEENTDVPA